MKVLQIITSLETGGAKTPVLLETPITSNSELRNLSCPLISESKLISEVVTLISFLFAIF